MMQVICSKQTIRDSQPTKVGFVSTHQIFRVGLKETLRSFVDVDVTRLHRRGEEWHKGGGWKPKPITALQYWFLGILWVPAEWEGKTAETNRQDGASEWRRRRRREWAPVKISSPLGDQLSSITRRIQLQREAERDTASICHTLTAGRV